jgi:hypothetical protein
MSREARLVHGLKDTENNLEQLNAEMIRYTYVDPKNAYVLFPSLEEMGEATRTDSEPDGFKQKYRSCSLVGVCDKPIHGT